MSRAAWIGLVVVAAVLGGAWLLLRQDDTATDDVSGTRHESDRTGDDPMLVGRAADAPAPASRAIEDDPVRAAWPDARTPRVPFTGVVLAPDGAPVRDAEIQARRGGGELSLVADESGRFATGIPAGRYDLAFTRHGVGGRFLHREVVDGSSWIEREVRLLPGGSVWLRFVGGDPPTAGRPVLLRLDERLSTACIPLVREGVTDADGVVRFDDVPPVNVVARVPVRDGWVLHQPLNVDSPKRPLDRHLPTGPGGVLRGTVRDAGTNAPVGGARVEAWLATAGSGARVEADTTSEADGTFAFPAIRGALLAFHVYADGYATWPTDDAAFQRSRHTWSPDRNEDRHPAYATLAEGLDRTIDVDLTRGLTVRGRVTDDGGRDVADLGFELVGFTRLGMVRFPAHTDVRGRFVVECLPRVDLTVMLTQPGWFADRPYRCRLVRTETPEPDPLDLVLRPARRLTGTVSGAGGAPVAGARVWIDAEDGAWKAALGYLRALGRRVETFTGPDGTWTLDDAPPWEEVDVRAALGDVTATPVPLAGEGPQPRPIPLGLGSAASIRGQVTKHFGWPRADGEVHLHPVPADDRRAPRVAHLSGRTAFEFQNVEPGRWKLTGHHGLYATGDALEVEAVAGEILDVELPLGVEVELAGVVVDDAGRALADVDVRLRGTWKDKDRRRHRVKEEARTDADGRFRFENTKPGWYDVQARATGYRAVDRHRLRGYERDVRVVLEPR